MNIHLRKSFRARGARLVLIMMLAAGLLASSGAAFASAPTPSDPPQFSGVAGDVYALTNMPANAVLIYHRAEDGTLTPIGNIYTQGAGTGAGLGSQGALAFSQDGRWLFAVDAASNDISVLRVEGDNLVFEHRVATGGQTPISLTISHDLLYVLDAGSSNITGFRISRQGDLLPLSGSTQPLSGTNVGPAQISFAPTGHSLVVTEKGTNQIDTYLVGNDGLAGPPIVHPSVGNTPFGFGWSGADHLVVSDAQGGGAGAGAVSSYRLRDDGGLDVLSGAAPDHQTAPCWIAVSGNGRYAYATNAGSGTISGFTVDSQGQLTLMNPDGITANIGAGSHPIDMAFGGSSRYLYALLTGTTTTGVAGFRVMPDGSLTALPVVSTGVTTATVGLIAR